jgi:hypothetical protein
MSSDIFTQSLSDTLEDKIQREHYGLFPSAVSKVSVPNHDDFKQQILEWMSTEDLQLKTDRNAISHNVAQVGPNNKLINDLPIIHKLLVDSVNWTNDNTLKYDAIFAIQDSYLEIHNKDAIYAPHEHSNCLYSLTYLINYDHTLHSPVKFRRNVQSSHYPVIQLRSTDMTPYNMTECTFDMSEGDIIIYPSHITHGYDTNPNDQRITLTANFVPQ